MLAGKTLLGKPARKMAAHHVEKREEGMRVQPLGEIGQARRRTSLVPDSTQATEASPRRSPAAKVSAMAKGLKKEARRRTIFVPSDDTTMLTIHPGANGRDCLDDTFQLSNFALPSGPTPPAAVMEDKLEREKPARKPRMSLAVAPRRLPLQHMAAKQNNLPSVDVPGQNGGKENLPPNGGELENVDAKTGKPVMASDACAKGSMARSKLFEPTTASQARRTIVVRHAVPVSKVQSKPTPPKSRQQQRSSPIEQRAAAAVRVEPQASRKTRFETSRDQAPRPLKRPTPPMREIIKAARLSRYPVLSEDISQPELYEESWLSHQEVALTELINEIFDTAQPAPQAWHLPTKALREHMLSIYHQPSVATLHKRLQASLLYGALSRPKDMPSPPCPTQDIGLRKRFLNLWLQTYNEEALRAAAEVVVGRQVPRRSCGSPNDLAASENVMDPAKGKRALIGFLETFFVNVDDNDTLDGEPEEPRGAEGRRWRKMILRSVMLIWLLDQAKSSGAVSGCLFNRFSSVKSSVAVLHALSSMLIPSIGDITRVLRHFDYEVEQIQDPLDEVVYRIKNLAIDLRDGVFFTRLVEILLFGSREKDVDDGQEATVTITLPDTTTLESALHTEDGSACPRILSQHLKLPCLGRAQKVHNVQVALSALAGHADSVETVASDVTADEIVDGHREKTLSLLWLLVSRHGLDRLVDWNELTADLRRCGVTPPLEHITQKQHKALLQAWATAHCMHHGVNVNNLTTSFADGKAYSALLDGFSVFLPTAAGEGGKANNPLEAKLRSLGCSTAFIQQLATPANAIPSRNTTISNLAFLASRLLPLARRHNAAMVIQRTYRRRVSRTSVSQRVALMRLANSCATVVQTQNRLTSAATVLQRAWRAVLDARISRLNKDVEAFQMLARGWGVRRWTRKAVVYGSSGAQSLRVMGGW